MASEQLTVLKEGMPLVYDGNKIQYVTKELAEAFGPGDRVIVVGQTDEVLHIQSSDQDVVDQAVGNAYEAFSKMCGVSEEDIFTFYRSFAELLGDDEVWSRIQQANDQDVEAAKARGRSTTRLIANEKMRQGMIQGLQEQMSTPTSVGERMRVVEHQGWAVEEKKAPLGVVGFVFEGRPNVLADATGVLRGGNTVVFRIGRDALHTAQVMMEIALKPALKKAGLPEGAVSLVESPSHASGWALFSDSRLSLAVARGSGKAVMTLGALAKQAGIPVSLHGTGGAWLIADEDADVARFKGAVQNSLDRKVCNTLNTCVLLQSQVSRLLPVLLEALKAAGDRRKQPFRLHVVEGDESYVPEDLFSNKVDVVRADGVYQEPQADLLPLQDLGEEWEWEESPEITLKIVADLDEAVTLYNTYSPRLVVSLISDSPKSHTWFYSQINAPFVGNGFTRWVDGQYALKQPELGLSNWEMGRIFARGAILNGDGVYSVRLRMRQDDPLLCR